MKITFIQPAVGKKAHTKYSKTWSMEPLSIAMVAGITPKHIEKVFYDDRIEIIPYDEPTDLAAITLETYTARRAYEIASEFRKRSIPVVMGGFHATLVTEEVMQHADAVVVGEAEASWPQLLEDFANNRLKKKYENATFPEMKGVLPDRSIFKGKKYLPIGLVESSRGCYYHCEFCSVYGFYNKKYRNRAIEDIVRDIKQSGKKFFFIVDDNVAMDRDRTIALCKAIKPLKINWFGQVSIHLGNDRELLTALKDSGCMGALIGFESLSKNNISQMDKNVNLQFADYQKAVTAIREHGMMIYGSFVFGYEKDSSEDFEVVYKFARKNKLFMNAFNHLVPFPGTPLYERFKKEGKLIHEKWWLKDGYRFGDVVFQPGQLNPEELSRLCYVYRKKYYSFSSILSRGMDLKANCSSLKRAMIFYLSNLSTRKDVEFRQGLPVGQSE